MHSSYSAGGFSDCFENYLDMYKLSSTAWYMSFAYSQRPWESIVVIHSLTSPSVQGRFSSAMSSKMQSTTDCNTDKEALHAGNEHAPLWSVISSNYVESSYSTCYLPSIYLIYFFSKLFLLLWWIDWYFLHNFKWKYTNHLQLRSELQTSIQSTTSSYKTNTDYRFDLKNYNKRK